MHRFTVQSHTKRIHFAKRQIIRILLLLNVSKIQIFHF